jgi:hypothetical protein
MRTGLVGDRQDNHVENDLETLYLEESQKIKEIVNEEVNPTGYRNH